MYIFEPKRLHEASNRIPPTSHAQMTADSHFNAETQKRLRTWSRMYTSVLDTSNVCGYRCGCSFQIYPKMMFVDMIAGCYFNLNTQKKPLRLLQTWLQTCTSTMELHNSLRILQTWQRTFTSTFDTCDNITHTTCGQHVTQHMTQQFNYSVQHATQQLNNLWQFHNMWQFVTQQFNNLWQFNNMWQFVTIQQLKQLVISLTTCDNLTTCDTTL